MQLLFDHLNALLVSAVIVLSLSAQQLNVHQDTLERQSVYNAKITALSFADWLERDVVKLGARFGSDRDRFTFVNEADGNGVVHTTHFEYYYLLAANGGVQSRVEVKYDVVAGDSILAKDSEVPEDREYVQLYTLTRSERTGVINVDPVTRTWSWAGGEPTWAVTTSHQSPYGLSHFLIEPRDSDGLVVTNPVEADYVRLRFSVTPTLFPLYRARVIPKSGLQWATTVEIRPF